MPSKASRFRNQNTACLNHFLLSSKTAFFTYKSLSFAQAFPCWFQNLPIFTNQKPFFCTNLSLLLSKAILFCPPPPIRTTLNLLFAKNAAVLLLFALNPYAVKPERRTDSNHCRRYPGNRNFQHSWVPDECRSFQKKSRIDRRFESSPESRGSQTSGVLLVLFVHAKSTKNVSFAGRFEVLQTSKQRTQTTNSHNPIKSFRRPWRLFFPPFGGVPAGTARSACFSATCGGYFSALRRCSLTGTFEVLQTSIQRTAAAVRFFHGGDFVLT